MKEMKPKRLAIALFACLGLVTGCSLITGSDDDKLCTSPPNMKIETGDDVRFRWGSCRADGLSVVGNTFEAVWLIEGEVRSPVDYGVAKKKTVVGAGPEQLVPGATYRLIMSIDLENDLTEVYQWTFTR